MNVIRRFKTLKLAQKFTLSVVFLILVSIVAVATLIIGFQRSSLRQEMDRNQIALVHNLSKDVVGSLISLDPLRLDELVRTIDQTPGCMYSGVVDSSGQIVAHTDRRLLGTYLSPELRQLLSGGQKEYVHGMPGTGVKEVLAPVMVSPEIIGAVLVGFSEASAEGLIEEYLRGLKRYLVLISTIVLVVGIAGAFGLARLLSTPLSNLKNTMERVQAGNLDLEVKQGSAVHCRDMLGCDREDCPAYGRERCWTIVGTMCNGAIQGDSITKIRECATCVVYRSYCGDEIGELTEVFNQMVKRLAENVKHLEETNREKSRLERLSALGEMSMTVAHEIKNPLNAIRGATTYLKDNFQGEVLQEFLSIIDEETRRLNDIVTSILRYAKPAPLRLQTGDINKIIGDTAELIRQEACENNVDLTLSLDSAVPQFQFDAQQFKQALLNLLVNALDATEAGDTVSISTALVDSRVLVVVKDTGKGMSDAAIADIFKPFYTTKTRGSGLGLACVERIVKDHCGEIAVKSGEGLGTEFEITLPLGR